MKIIVFAASSREGSFNKKLASLADSVFVSLGVETVLSDISAYEVPTYNGDVELSSGIPANAEKFRSLLESASALVIISPEYNFSVPGNLKNLIDWASRTKPQPFRAKHILLASASPSMVGGNRGLWSLRVPLEALGAHVFPDMFSLSLAHEAFNNDNKLKDDRLNKDFEKNITAFLNHVSKGELK